MQVKKSVKTFFFFFLSHFLFWGFVCLLYIFCPPLHSLGAKETSKAGNRQTWYVMTMELWCVGCVTGTGWGYSCSAEEDTNVLPAGRIPMCCWPSNTKLPIGWPSGLYAAPWLTEGSRRKPDCSQSWTQRRKKRRHTKQSAIVPASALKRYIQYLGCHFKLRLCFLWADYVTRTIE